MSQGLATMKSIELFAGAGGLALGTAKAGMHHAAVLEWDGNACATLRRNQAMGVAELRGSQIIQGDVRDHDFTQHQGEVDFVIGGPPCQPFSLGGRHKGPMDQRDMFPEAIRAVREIMPKAFIFENVKGLLRQTFANYYQYIIHQLEFPTVTRKGDEEWTDHLARLEAVKTSGRRARDTRYNVVYQLLNAADYGVPQCRHRVLVVGVRADLGVEFSFPAATHSEDALLYDKWVTGDYWDRHRVPKRQRPQLPDNQKRRIVDLAPLMPIMLPKPWRTVRDAIHDLPKLRAGQTSPEVPNHYFNPGARSYHGHSGSPLDEPAKTLKAGAHGVPGGENTLRFSDGEVRYFSVRECARLQTFPDNWVFEGSWTESMRQLGNAVPVQLAEVVATRLAQVVQPVISLSDSLSRAMTAARNGAVPPDAGGNARRSVT
jgi:DNA (cytosine-5)-methyltransferase 1